MQVTFYSKENCISCVMTAKWLDKHGVDYEYIDVTGDDEVIKFLINSGYQEMPVIMVEDSTGFSSFTGYRPDSLKILLGK